MLRSKKLIQTLTGLTLGLGIVLVLPAAAQAGEQEPGGGYPADPEESAAVVLEQEAEITDLGDLNVGVAAILAPMAEQEVAVSESMEWMAEAAVVSVPSEGQEVTVSGLSDLNAGVGAILDPSSTQEAMEAGLSDPEAETAQPLAAEQDTEISDLGDLNAGVAVLLDPSAAQETADTEVAEVISVYAKEDTEAAATEDWQYSAGQEVSEEAAVSREIVITEEQAAGEELTIAEELTAEEAVSEEEVAPEEQSDLVMANVQNVLNVRADASEEAEKVGLLYKDCGGRILERRDGWTKLQSGELVGWASDEYLLFGEEAKALAEEVGNLIVTIQTDALRVRKEPNTEAGVYGLLAQDDELDVVEEVNAEWICVEYEDGIGYVSSQYVHMDFHIDEGETLEAIREREEAEAREKAKLTSNRGAVVAGADDTRLLAALIYCEAGNQGYEGQLAVGATVMNRVRSSAYPNSISGVIYASGQFPPALNGKVARVYAGNVPDSCIRAAQEAIAGASNIGGATHFRRAGSREGIVIGDHVFW